MLPEIVVCQILSRLGPGEGGQLLERLPVILEAWVRVPSITLIEYGGQASNPNNTWGVEGG